MIARTNGRPAPIPEPRVLREYALIADGERGALLGPHGEIAWLGFPGWDGGILFGALVGGGGRYSVSPADVHVWGGRYVHGTLIWCHRWLTRGGALIECREALAFPGERERAVVLRRLEARSDLGEVDVRIELVDPVDGRPLRPRRSADAWLWRGGGLEARLIGAPELGGDRQGCRLAGTLAVPGGTRRDLVLEVVAGRLGREPPDPDAAWAATETGWRQELPSLDEVPARRDALHACAVLRGLQSATGGVVAAATTSLPERMRSGGDYDYRYVWLRDLCYAGQAAAAAGWTRFVDRATGYLVDRLLSDGDRLRPCYTAAGRHVPRERHLDLPGYPGCGTVVTGNRASTQFQLDVPGEALLLLAAAADHDLVDAPRWAAAETAGAIVEKAQGRPDTGVWELEPRQWTHSRLICAAGLRAMASRAAPGAVAAGWLRLADALVAGAAADCVHSNGRWKAAPDCDRLDAALLLPAIRGAVAADDPRSVATLSAVEAELVEDGYCYRFREDTRPLGATEGAFLLCNHWLALARLQRGDLVGAARSFERARAGCGPAGLYAEEYDVAQRQLRGNLPQAFVHAALLEAAVRLGEAGVAE